MSSLELVYGADLSKVQREQCLNLLVSQFAQDQGVRALWGDANVGVSDDNLRAWFASLLSMLGWSSGAVIALVSKGQVVGVAITTGQQQAFQTKRMVKWVWQSVRKVGIGVTARTVAHDRMRSQFLPTRPHLVVEFICIANNSRGKGLVSKMFEEIDDLARRHKLEICLETTKQQNAPIFEKYGFAETTSYTQFDVLNVCMAKPV